MKSLETTLTSTIGNCVVTLSNRFPDWERYLGHHVEATIFHDPRWGSVMRSTYRNPAFYLTAHRDGGVVGVLQLSFQKSMVFGSRLCSLPYLDAAGILADDVRAEQALLESAEHLRRQLGANWVEIRHTRPLTGSIPTRTDKVKLVLALPSSPDDLPARFTSKRRQEIRQALREDFTVQSGGHELLEPFYRVYVRAMRNVGSPPHKRDFFRAILETFGSAARIIVISKGPQSVAASFNMVDRHAMYALWGATDLAEGGNLANVRFYLSMFTEAIGCKVAHMDCGRSTRDSGAYRFKQKWGMEEVPLYWHHLLRPGMSLPTPPAESRKYRFVSSVWRRLPVWLVRAYGPKLVGKLS